MKDSVALDCLDRPRRLRFDVNSCAEIWEQTGKEFTELLPQRWAIGSTRIFLWAGLRWEDPKLTVQSTGALLEQFLIGGGQINELANKLNEAIEVSGFLKALVARSNGNGNHEDPPSGSGSPTEGRSSTEDTA